MSTIITSASNAFLTLIETSIGAVAGGYTKIPNPYKPEENTDLFLKLGYGLTLDAGQNSNRTLDCYGSIDRSVTVILTRKLLAREDDRDAKFLVEQLLFEDQIKIIKNVEMDSSIGVSTVYTRYVSDNGIEYVSGNTDKFLMLRTSFSLEYLEQLP